MEENKINLKKPVTFIPFGGMIRSNNGEIIPEYSL